MQKGYDQFFKQARKASAEGAVRKPASSPGSRPKFAIPKTNEGASSPEEKVKQMLENRIKEKRKAIASRRKPFPKGPMVAAALGLVLTGAGIVFPDSIDWLYRHVEIGVFGPAQAANANEKGDGKTGDTEKAAGTQATSAANPASKADAPKVDAAPDTRGWTPEELSFFNKLGERKRELDLREAELNKLEEELQKQRVELDDKIKQLETTRAQIALTLKGRVETDQTKVTKLVEVYSGMKPAQAAKVMETINEDLAVQVLEKMKKKSAADILNVMAADKAQRLSEMLAGYKRN